ncbi:glutamine synthetase [Reticulibacter mediterranei]|uniref:Glutamine synthetase n=1 Tax=Reticulibacter mediterranei TaxID=2778369 RepID=A0A8J3J2M3_9CHLR|nr:glutamine synthetase family protein [Reticulibacter mediterranei]GHO99636.1 glutamine synthetase [Reticulibacter mediterranei]
MSDQSPLKHLLTIPYDELEELNLAAREKRDTVSAEEQEQEYRAYLEKEKHVKAVTLCFSDLEGRFHMLDYDKKFLLASADNLTFDGSSIRGFTSQHESDLRLQVDWTSFLWLPADLFGAGKVMLFANVLNRSGGQYESDFRGLLQQYLRELDRQEGLTAYVSAEVEGIVVEGSNAEQRFDENTGFQMISRGGYFHSLPRDPLRQFIDTAAGVQRAMGFKNEKDHPEVAPSQFEMNFSYTHALRTADLIQLYKLICRQVANTLGMTATFLPKPVMGINGSGMHTNISLAKHGKNIFYDRDGEEYLSTQARDFIARILNHAQEMCLVLNTSVNAYRRLDPHFEAPNQIQVSPIDRGSMIRIPVGNEKTARIEVRSVAPDANPYLLLYTLLQTGLNGDPLSGQHEGSEHVRLLPGTIQEAIEYFEGSHLMRRVLGETNVEKYLSYKQMAADRSPRALGTQIKTSEIIYHHEVTNQALWNMF